MTTFSPDHDANENYPRDRVGELIAAVLIFLAAAIFLCVLVVRVAHHEAPVTPDTGWHMAIANDSEYRIDLPYAQMDDSQRDDANRFSHLHPDGE